MLQAILAPTTVIWLFTRPHKEPEASVSKRRCGELFFQHHANFLRMVDGCGHPAPFQYLVRPVFLVNV